MEKEYTHCLRCGRKLKSQKARSLGYGLICYSKMKKSKQKYKKLF